MIQLASDKNFDSDIVRGLLAECPSWTSCAFSTLIWLARPDHVILDWAAREDRILLNHDRDTMSNLVYARVRAGEPLPGVFLISNRMPKGQAVEELFLAVNCLPAEDCKDQIKYFPL